MEKQKRIVGDDSELLIEIPKKKHEEYMPPYVFPTIFRLLPAIRHDYIALVFSLVLIGIAFWILAASILMSSVDARHFNGPTSVPTKRPQPFCHYSSLPDGEFEYFCR